MSGSHWFRMALLLVVGWLGCPARSVLGQEVRRDSQSFSLTAEQQGTPRATADENSLLPPANEIRVLLSENPHADELATETGIGVSLVPVDPTLRSHLQLPEGQGLVVASVTPDSPAAKAGIEPRDVLTKAGDQVLSAAADLDKALQSETDRPLRVGLIRAGKPREVTVAPLKRVSFVLRDLAAGPYWIGVQVNPADETLRAQLELPDKQGLVAATIFPDSPAVAAGLKPNDVLVSLGGKPLTAAEDLVARIQEAKEQPITLQLIRGGKPMKIQITPRTRAVGINLSNEEKADYLLRFVRPNVLVGPQQADFFMVKPQGFDPAFVARLEAAGGSGQAMEQKLNELINEVKELRKAIQKIESSLPHERGPAPANERP